MKEGEGSRTKRGSARTSAVNTRSGTRCHGSPQSRGWDPAESTLGSGWKWHRHLTPKNLLDRKAFKRRMWSKVVESGKARFNQGVSGPKYSKGSNASENP